MATKWSRMLALVVLLTFVGSSAYAAVLSEETFDDTPPGGPIYPIIVSQVGLPRVDPAFTTTGGVGGSPAMMFTFGPARTIDDWIGLKPYPTPIDASDSSPIGGLSTLSPSQIRFSIDISSVGNTSATPIALRVFQRDQSYEADRGVDANGDGDMTDDAFIFESVFNPTIVSGAGFATASFRLDNGIQAAYILPKFPQTGTIPLAPVMDPTVPFNWSITFGPQGYGIDSGNVVTLDNIRIELVPEPSAVALATMAVCVASLFRRRA